MTAKETFELLQIIQAYYPNFRIEDKSIAIKAWHSLFAEQDYKAVLNALKAFL